MNECEYGALVEHIDRVKLMDLESVSVRCSSQIPHVLAWY